jgi:primosomal protein N''
VFTTGQNVQNVLQNVTQTLNQLRAALEQAQNTYKWTSGLQVSDLVTLGFTTADAQSILSACADANALASFYNTGLPPGTYPQPPSAYIYGASVATILGP